MPRLTVIWFRIILFNLVANKSKTHVFSRRVFGIKRKEIMSENKSFHRIFLSLKQRFWQEFLCHHHFNVLRVTSRRLELVANANWHNTIRLKKFLTSQFVLLPYSLKIVLKNHHYNSMLFDSFKFNNTPYASPVHSNCRNRKCVETIINRKFV